MRAKVVLTVLALSMAVLSLAAFGGALAPDQQTVKLANTHKPISATRVYMLMPDGKIEISDTWARRVFKWDGRRWIEVESKRLETPSVDSR